MDNEAFYNQRNLDESHEYNSLNRESEWRENAPARNVRYDRDISDQYDIDGQPFDPAQTYGDTPGVSSFDHDFRIGRGGELQHGRNREAGWRGEGQVDDFVVRDRQSVRSPRQDDKYSSKYGDDIDRKTRPRGFGHGAEDASGRGHQRSKSREGDRVRDADRHTRDRERSRDRERRTRRDDSGYGKEREDSDYRSRRRSRSRDRDRDRDRRHRDSDRDRRHRDSDRDRPRRDHDRDRGDRESSPKDVPWVPPPLPEHLRHLQVQWALTPVASTQQSSSSASKLALQPPPPPVQNQFQNDGSFLEMFRQKMQKKSAGPTSDDSNTCEGPAPSSVGSGVAAEEASIPAAPPTLPANSSGVPVIAKRRISKILKTGIVQKKKKEEEEEVDKDGDSWSSYMKEVQKYRANKCIENEASRPPLVK